jgi:hypothetical protein
MKHPPERIVRFGREEKATTKTNFHFFFHSKSLRILSLEKMAVRSFIHALLFFMVFMNAKHFVDVSRTVL